MLDEVPAQFWTDLSRAPRRALLLDYDGTLAPFTPQRDLARPYPGVAEALSTILAQGRTRVVLVTGRDARDLPELMPLSPRPEIWGSHGLERVFPDGSYKPLALPPATITALEQAQSAITEHAPDTQIEAKPGCVAVHWRGMETDAAQQLRELVMTAWQPLDGTAWLALREFDGGMELRCIISTKADAVRTIAGEESHGLVLAYLGDDQTDEDAFAAIPEGGLSVLVRSVPRESRAQVWLKPPMQLLDFLSRWQTACQLSMQAGQ